MKRYGLCVLGAGSAGVAAAEAARDLGRDVVLVTEEGALGGTCILRGCMPAKTVLSSTQRLGDVESAGAMGVTNASHAKIDLARVIARKRELVDYFAEDRVDEIRSFPLLRGRARFTGPDTIDVAGEAIAADAFVIATGSRIDPSVMPCLSPGDAFTSDDALEMTHAPRRLAVIGGGPVGCEFAQYFARAGSQVTLLQDGSELLRADDPDIGESVRRALEADGVRVLLDVDVTGCSREGDARRIRFRERAASAGANDREIVVDGVMLATGRVPNVAALDLARAGVTLAPSGGIAVDEFLRTANPRVFAAGDVIGRRNLVHVAVYAGRLAARNALGERPVRVDFDRYEVHAVYVQPGIAVAGLTETEAAARGVRVRVRRHPFREVGKAIVDGEPAGFVKMLADDDDVIRGIAIAGEDAAELAGEAVALVDRRMTLAEAAELPHLHPTLGEIFARVAEDFEPAGPAAV